MLGVVMVQDDLVTMGDPLSVMVTYVALGGFNTLHGNLIQYLTYKAEAEGLLLPALCVCMHVYVCVYQCMCVYLGLNINNTGSFHMAVNKLRQSKKFQIESGSKLRGDIWTK